MTFVFRLAKPSQFPIQWFQCFPTRGDIVISLVKSKASPVLGSFSKGVDSAASVNMGASGGPNCDTGCRHHSESTAPEHLRTYACYAIVVEKRHDRKQLADKLLRHQAMPPALLIGRAIVELQDRLAKGKAVTWLRFSTNGSLPNPEQADRLFIGQLRVLLTICRANSIRVHMPVETESKAEFYRQQLGELCTVRESIQDPADILKFRGACSMVVGEHIRSGKNIRQRRVEHARQVAKQRKESTGRNTIVCPAITSGWSKLAGKRSDKILCGQCTACSNPDIDVLYPIH